MSTEQKPRANCANPRLRRGSKTAAAFFVPVLAAAALVLGGCTKASFPSESIPGAIEKICKDLYKLDVVAEVSGKTIGVLFYTDHLIDEKGQMDQKLIRKTIGDLVLTITRVALSTDLDVRSVVVAIRGQKDFNEIRIIRNMDDIKKAQTEALSMDESLNRTLWEQSKYHSDALDPDYFPLKDLTLESFLAKQIVQRVRFAAQNLPRAKARFRPS